METTICRVYIGVILGYWKIKWKLLYVGFTLGLYWDSGTGDGNYYM